MLQEIRFETRIEPLPQTNGRVDGFHAKSLDLSNNAAESLAAALRTAIEGEVRFDNGSRGAYSTDASNYRQIPIGVVIPRTVEDVVKTVSLCHQYGVPVTSRGGGTSLAGQCCNVAVILDFSKYLNQVLRIDPERKLAVVEPGCVLDTLRTATEQYGLTFGPDPATHSHNTLGGMIGNNSCGIHSVMAQFYGPARAPRITSKVWRYSLTMACG